MECKLNVQGAVVIAKIEWERTGMFRLEWERKSEVARNRKDRKIGEERKNREDGFRSGTFVTIIS